MRREDTQCSLKPISQIPILASSMTPFHCTHLLYSTHAQLLHTGVNCTLTAVRQVYWISTGRQYVKVLLCRCVIYKKHSVKPYKARDTYGTTTQGYITRYATAYSNRHRFYWDIVLRQNHTEAKV